MRDWVTNLSTTHYLVGSAIGPHPFPTIVRDFQRVIGKEIKQQLQEVRGKLPDAVVACVGGGSNAIGTFYDFIPDKQVRLVGVEAGGEGESHVARRWVTHHVGCRPRRRQAQCYSGKGTSGGSTWRPDVPFTVSCGTDYRDALGQRWS